MSLHTTRKPGGWSSARQRLAAWDKPALLALVKDLYELAEANRNFIQAGCQAGEDGGGMLEKRRARIVEQFYSRRAHGMGPLKLGEARKAIRECRKATGDLPGAAELLLAFVENGARGVQKNNRNMVLRIIGPSRRFRLCIAAFFRRWATCA